MDAFQVTGPGRVQRSELPLPRPGHGQVLVRVLALGLCGSDLATYRGRNPMVRYPVVPGHEIAGEIASVGAGAKLFVTGTRVTIMPYTSCGSCPSCRTGNANACRDNRTLGVRRPGAATEYLVVDERDLVPADGLSVDQAACIEPLAVGWHAADRARAGRGESVLVMGCGVVGLGAIAACALRGARVIAVDVDEGKFERARMMGANEVVRADAGSLPETIAGLTGGDGPEACIEASGAPGAAAACTELAAFSGRVVLVGYASGPTEVHTRLVVSKELEIKGSRNATRADFDAVVSGMRQGRLEPARLITHRFPLARLDEALAYWDTHQGEVAKIIVGAGEP